MQPDDVPARERAKVLLRSYGNDYQKARAWGDLRARSYPSQLRGFSYWCEIVAALDEMFKSGEIK